MKKVNANDLLTKIFGESTFYLEKGKPPREEITPGILGNIIDKIKGIFGGGSNNTDSYQPTPTPTSVPQQYNQGFNLNIPSSQDETKNTTVPQNLAQLIGGTFDPVQEATRSAQVLHHPYMEQIKNYGYGENAGFNTGEGWDDFNYDEETNELKYVDNPFTGQKEPSEDRGLFRINNGTFYMLQNSKNWKDDMKKAGIKSYDDMYDPEKNIKMAKIIGDWYEKDLGLPRWSGWFAAPKEFGE